MCGISGFVSPNYNKEHLIKMTNSLSHRGPNAEVITLIKGHTLD